MQSGGFRGLASLLPVPAYGLSWPKGARARSEWPATLDELVELFLKEVQSLQASGPYIFAGHSFGATVCIKMAQVIEKRGEKVAFIALLDPRSLAPIKVDIGGEFAKTGLPESLALLSQTASDGSRYADYLEELSRVEPAGRDEALRGMLSPAALASLEHVHQTSQWYSSLLGGDSLDHHKLVCPIAVVRAAETWLQTDLDPKNRAEQMVRDFQAATFQTDTEVKDRLTDLCGDQLQAPVLVPGTHFSMLHEPHVVTVALRLGRYLSDVPE